MGHSLSGIMNGVGFHADKVTGGINAGLGGMQILGGFMGMESVEAATPLQDDRLREHTKSKKAVNNIKVASPHIGQMISKCDIHAMENGLMAAVGVMIISKACDEVRKRIGISNEADVGNSAIDKMNNLYSSDQSRQDADSNQAAYTPSLKMR